MAAPGDALKEYQRKRDFRKTAEPRGKAGRKSRSGLMFAVQKHAARREHYDLRLEWDGVLMSWAVTRGPSLDPGTKRLAVRTEDHPMDYGTFEGTIPKGEYGGGTVMLWDRGSWEPLHDAGEGLQQGKLHFRVVGERMKGGWALVRMRGKQPEKRENWLLIKERDDAAQDDGDALTRECVTSVASGRSMDEITADKSGKAAGSPATPKKRATRSRQAGKAGRLPDFRKPQLATLVSEAPDGDNWVHEIKFDGYRCVAAVGSGEARCYSRSGLDWSDRFAPVAEALRDLKCKSALLDGEVVAKDGPGSQFSALQKALSEGGPLTYFAFDLMVLDGADLTAAPLSARKEKLRTLLGNRSRTDTVQYCEHVRGGGPKVLEQLCKARREGLIAKKADAPYRHRRTRSWLKVKCDRRQEFVIGGWSPSDKPGRAFASLLLGTYDGERLRYRGRVGIGFSDQTLRSLGRTLKANARKSPPFADLQREIVRGARWVTPRLVAEVKYAEFTSDGYVRHGVFLGLREDKEAEAVTLERETNAPEPGAGTVRGIALTHPGRVVYADQGLTKLDLARYYDAVADRMMPHLQRRPLSLVRCPQGSASKCFFQKHASQGFPEALGEIEIEEASGQRKPYLTVTDVAGVVAAVQMGALEFHIWGCRTDQLEKPDRLVFDLDPDEGIGFAEVKAAAFDVRGRLADLGLDSDVLVTGGKGVHVIAPLRRTADWGRVKAFAKGMAQAMTTAEPHRFTATMSKQKRKGRIFIDWLRNERGATAIAPYSTRARAGAPVALPVSWDELKGLKAANRFSTADARARLDDADPWARSRAIRQSVTVAMVDSVRDA